MASLYDDDGIDGPWERRMKQPIPTHKRFCPDCHTAYRCICTSEVDHEGACGRTEVGDGESLCDALAEAEANIK